MMISRTRLALGAVGTLLLAWLILAVLIAPHAGGVTAGEAAVTWAVLFGGYITAVLVPLRIRRDKTVR